MKPIANPGTADIIGEASLLTYPGGDVWPLLVVLSRCLYLIEDKMLEADVPELEEQIRYWISSEGPL